MEPITNGHQPNEPVDIETREWLESLDFVIENGGPERVLHLLQHLQIRAEEAGIKLPFSANTPYINTIPVNAQPAYPGNRQLERRIKSLIRWNAMAMVVRANRVEAGIGGHISTFASAATLYEVAFNHFDQDFTLGAGQVFERIGKLIFHVLLDGFGIFLSLSVFHTLCFSLILPIQPYAFDGIWEDVHSVTPIAHILTVFLIIGKDRWSLDHHFGHRRDHYASAARSLGAVCR